jgi:hypothetical protein
MLVAEERGVKEEPGRKELSEGSGGAGNSVEVKMWECSARAVTRYEGVYL